MQDNARCLIGYSDWPAANRRVAYTGLSRALKAAANEVRSLSRLRERVGERGVSTTGQSPRGKSPHPALRADLSRKRERLRRAGGE